MGKKEKKMGRIFSLLIAIFMLIFYSSKSYASSDAEVFAEILPFIYVFDSEGNLAGVSSSVPVIVDNNGVYLVSAYVPTNYAAYVASYIIGGAEYTEYITPYISDETLGYCVYQLSGDTGITKGFEMDSIGNIATDTILVQVVFDENSGEYQGIGNYCVETDGNWGQFYEEIGNAAFGSPVFNNDNKKVVGVTLNSKYFVTMDVVYAGFIGNQTVETSGGNDSSNGNGSSDGTGGGTTTDESNSGGGIPWIIIVAIIGAGVGGFFYLRKKKEKDNSAGSGVSQVDGTVNSLVGVGGEHAGLVIPINEPIVFGRDKNRCNMMFPSTAQGISSLHCQVSKINGKIEVTDLGSTYGTFLDNGTKLTPHVPQQLMPGQGFYLADRKYSYRIQ